ncbi:hypothetical protein PSHT_14059 [Puccinia striiformis]|uniref:Uncharacterized protein n=1 Tax=Puccinia striiformis TaxID=27350 RepID=A0A2S4UM82_9BASI|nr:hypothetical protein PSHT_14059 [Puccinia striiformis]
MPQPSFCPLTIINRTPQPHSLRTQPFNNKSLVQYAFRRRHRHRLILHLRLRPASRPRWIRWSRLPRFPPAQFPGLGGFDGPSCSNQNGLINAAVLTETHCHGSGGGTGPMRCGNQGGDPSGGGLLGGLLGPGNALLNVNALSTVDCYN